jgi:FMN hydrolase / 5-amino-6-(5-phospho-D-ribitylamino)uracil phosphatase
MSKLIGMPNLKPVRAILFDLDDTLWPIRPLIEGAEAALHAWMSVHAPAVVERYSITQMRELRSQLVSTDLRFSYDLWALRHAALSQVLAESGAPVSLADQGMQVFAHARNQVEIFDDVLPALAALSERVSLGAVSNGFADITAIGLDRYFSVALAAHQFGCAKPDARIFEAACAALKLTPDEVMFVGDDLRLDVHGAQQIGMRGVWMNRFGIEPEPALAHIKPDVVVQNLHQLLAYV